MRVPKPKSLVMTAIAVIVLGIAAAWLGRPYPPEEQTPGAAPPAVFSGQSATGATAGVVDLGTSVRPRPRLVASPFQNLSLLRGWSAPEQWGVWAWGDEAEIRVRLGSVVPRTLLVRAWALEHPDHPNGQQVQVFFNGQDCGSMSFGPRPKSRRLTIPVNVQSAGQNSIVFRFAYHATPSEVGFGDDSRSLAAGFLAIGLAPTERRMLAPNRLTDTLNRVADRLGFKPGPAATVEDGGILVHEPGIVSIPVVDRGESSRLELSFATEQPIDPSLSRVTVVVSPISGEPKKTNRIDLAQWQHSRGNGMSGSVEIEIPEPSIVLVDSELTPRDTDLSLQWLRHRSATEQQTSEVSPPTEPPDIVLIILDAARADHFGFAGYDRRTTPNIDALADGSLVFDAAYALAPYTLCSVPTMITGHSFLRHGVVDPGHRLHESATTLAERLRDAGYRTGCYSATPNNSKALGFDQGFEHFEEAWRGVNEAAALDPRRLSRMAAEWLERPGDDRPVFLMVHYVPPHEPYNPPPEFNLFVDPGYTGGADGSWATLRAIDHRSLRAGPEDHEHIVNLYDGNLLHADFAVGELLDVLRQRSRWNETVVLLTSDHGEAMGEHGRMGHNSTVFDEMLHVPFVLRLPAELEQHPIDRNSLVSLADTTPTLLGRAGIRWKDQLDGVDLLDGTRRTDRYLILRTAPAHPTYGVRTARWKLIHRRVSIRQLFDLANDPGEADDVAWRESGTAAGLTHILWQELSHPALFDASSGGVPINPDDAEMLRALGYAD